MSEAVNTEVNDPTLDLALKGEVKEAELPEGVQMEMYEWVFTNDKANPMPRQLFHTFMEAAFKNKIGIMHALHKESGKIHTVLVGIEHTPEGTVAWPLAKILVEEEQAGYLSPDGNGGYPGYEG